MIGIDAADLAVREATTTSAHGTDEGALPILRGHAHGPHGAQSGLRHLIGVAGHTLRTNKGGGEGTNLGRLIEMAVQNVEQK